MDHTIYQHFQNLRLIVIYIPVKLSQLYNLSFGFIRKFDTFFVCAQAEGQRGYGEITPLPGYSNESPTSIRSALKKIDIILQKKNLKDALDELANTDPFVVSGITCAIETLSNHRDFLYINERPISIPLCALCDAEDPVRTRDRALELVEMGFSDIKIKVGRCDIAYDLDRVTLAAESVAGKASLRLDANQAYNIYEALELCKGLEKLSNISFLEQPFKPDAWEDTAYLTRSTSVPIMLDESIWNSNDVIKAYECGARYVKFKLCKHRGIKGSLDLIELAYSLNLKVVYGNGVQTALGNHLEAGIFLRSELDSAFEGNGFLKVSFSPFAHKIKIISGYLYDDGIDLESLGTLRGEKVLDVQCNL